MLPAGVAVLLSVLYFGILMPVRSSGDQSLFERGLDSPLRLWLNGYLGVFFNLRFLGNSMWLLFPMLFLGLLNWRSLKAWRQGLLLFLFVAIVVIGAMGGFNYRYSFTLVPVLLMLLVAVLNERMELEGLAIRARDRVFLGLALAAVVNLAMAVTHRRMVAAKDPARKAAPMAALTDPRRLDSTPKDLDGWLTELGVGPGDTVLVNNLPIYFYTTDRVGVYYWCGSDTYYGPSGERSWLRTRTDDEAAIFMRDSLQSRFIFGDENLNRYDPRYQSFLNTHCTLLATDPKGHTLHRLADTFGR